jgi:hypothetical protein
LNDDFERNTFLNRFEFGFLEKVIGNIEGRAHKRIFASPAASSMNNFLASRFKGANLARMDRVRQARLRLRSELEAPPALRKFGSGWLSGVLGFVLGAGGLLLVICLRFPGVFTMPEMQKLERSASFHLALQVLLIAAFVLSAISVTLRPSKILGGCGIVATLLATLLGGSTATAAVADKTPLYLGLDWFVLRVILTGLLFVPFERLSPH